MQQIVIMKKGTKMDLEILINELFCGEFNITTHDKEYYMFYDKEKPELEYHYHWTELCLTHIPEALGINYIIIPLNDPKYNLAEYMIDYYKSMFNNIDEKGKDCIRSITYHKEYEGYKKSYSYKKCQFREEKERI